MDDHEREVRRLRVEARARQVDVESAEAELAIAQTCLMELLCDWAARGRRLRLDATDRRRLGLVSHVGDSVVTLRVDGSREEVIALAHVEGVVVADDRPLAAPGSWTRGHPRTMVAHLRSLVGEGEHCTIERRSTAPIEGELIGVAETHATVRGASGELVVVPLAAIVSVTTRL